MTMQATSSKSLRPSVLPLTARRRRWSSGERLAIRDNGISGHFTGIAIDEDASRVAIGGNAIAAGDFGVFVNAVADNVTIQDNKLESP